VIAIHMHADAWLQKKYYPGRLSKGMIMLHTIAKFT